MLLYCHGGEVMLENILKDKNFFIFDLDGTLIDSVGIWNKIDQKLIEDLGHVLVPEGVINLNRDHIIGSSVSGAPYEDYVLYLNDKYNLGKTVEELYDYRRAIMNEFLKMEVKKKPYAKELIEILKELGMTLVLATTTTRHNIATYCNDNPDTMELNLESNFSLILSMEDVAYFKPNPEIFNKVIDMMNVDKSKAIVIEDSIVGIKAAKAAGLDSIAVREEHSAETTDELRSSANFYIDSLKEINDLYAKKVAKKAKKTQK